MSINRSFTVGELSANADFPALDMNEKMAAGRPLTHRLVVTGSGAVAGTLTLYRGVRCLVAGTETVVYDTTAAATIAVTGTNAAAESESFEVTGSEHWRGVLSGISGTGAVARWVVSYADPA